MRKKKQAELENVKIARHLTGKFSSETESLIKEKFLKSPETPITTEFFKKLIRNGSVFVKVSEENAPSEEVEITSQSIYPLRRHSDGTVEKDSINVYSVTVFTSGGFGVKFKTLKQDNNKVIVL